MRDYAIWRGSEIHPGDKLLIEVEFVRRDASVGEHDFVMWVRASDGYAGFTTFVISADKIDMIKPREVKVGGDVVFMTSASNKHYKVLHLHEDWAMVMGYGSDDMPVVARRGNLIAMRGKP